MKWFKDLNLTAPLEFYTFAQMNALRQFFAIYCLLAAIAVQSQNRPLNLSKDDRQLRGGPSLNDSFNRSSQDQDSLFGKRSKQLFTEKDQSQII